MKIIVLNHKLNCVDVVTIPTHYSTTFIEERLSDLYDLDDISWMKGDDEGTPVFYNNEECPVYVL